MSISPEEFDSARYRQVMGHFPTGVTIVTAMVGDQPAGFTIGSFTSVSLEPPLVGFLPQTNSETWAAMAPGGKFCVNVLGTEQGDDCWRFAKKGIDDRFDGVAWRPSASGSPILDRSIAWIDCAIDSVHELGDHYFVVGRVTSMSHCDHEPEPLLFFKGKLGVFQLLQ